MEYRESQTGIELFDGDKKAGEITWSNADEEMIIIDHTIVEDEYAGKGYAKDLVNQMANYARREHKKVIPLCPFTHSVFLKNPDAYQDIWRR